MTRGSKKVAAKRAAYDETMAAQPTKSKKVLPNWMRHRWDVENDRLKTSSQPGFMPRPNQNWHP
ncbi:hypothetical protein ELH43_38735 [Rhizobium ruizarguesonis]|uniref:hypothetical protein n=1 Tax=Rhizobium ruizarguesonis TaxID=2081791 RepID=UPI00102F3A78|nr:hypothetical protein [Rhizobium ruizarguesonis]TBB59413.1 hypothetical protein ELH43_38735 [Rhizobium ruizarguesonis]TBC12678.1 hypothetical protein ELH35_38205 [Rhizobium ruizarguesonis]